MKEKEVQKILDEMQDVRPEKLNKEAKRLFEAIMKIADRRDKLEILVKNQQERIEYLERSCNRREDNFIECEQENLELQSKIADLEKQLREFNKIPLLNAQNKK